MVILELGPQVSALATQVTSQETGILPSINLEVGKVREWGVSCLPRLQIYEPVRAGGVCNLVKRTGILMGCNFLGKNHQLSDIGFSSSVPINLWQFCE